MGHAGHHDEVTAGAGDVGSEGGAFGADAFLGDLDDDFLAAAEALLGMGGTFMAWGFAADFFHGFHVAVVEVGAFVVGEVFVIIEFGAVGGAEVGLFGGGGIFV